jgi:predicted MPP superfamily phosphohydrolase
VDAEVGPFHAQFALTPSLTGGSEVRIPPLGALHLASHGGPAHLVVHLDTLDQQRTKALVTDPNGLARAGDSAVEDLQNGVRRLALQVLGVSVLGAMALAALVYRSMRRVAACGGLALAVVAATAVVTVGTFRETSIEEPRYEGLLTNAPAVIGDARSIAGRFSEYRAELQRLVQNVGRLYGTISTLPVYEPDTGTTRVLHISDMHLNPAAWSVVQTVVQQFNIDVVVDTGDITDWGSEPEKSYVSAIGALKVPYIFIRGNHDSAVTAAAVASQPNATVLDNTIITVNGLTIAGISDPRFTPDKSTGGPKVTDGAANQLQLSGERLANTIENAGKPVDIAMVHDPASTPPLAGRCPVVLAGHLHRREIRRLDVPAVAPLGAKPTLVMVEGSTGGAGLRGLEATDPLPLALSVLYFDTTHTLQAYDDIQVGGTGLTEVLLQRHVVKPTPEPEPSGSPSPTR